MKYALMNKINRSIISQWQINIKYFTDETILGLRNLINPGLVDAHFPSTISVAHYNLASIFELLARKFSNDF